MKNALYILLLFLPLFLYSAPELEVMPAKEINFGKRGILRGLTFKLINPPDEQLYLVTGNLIQQGSPTPIETNAEGYLTIENEVVISRAFNMMAGEPLMRNGFKMYWKLQSGQKGMGTTKKRLL